VSVSRLCWFPPRSYWDVGRCPALGWAVPPPASRTGADERVSYVDQIVSDHAQADPSLHAFGAAVSASAQAVPPFDYADPSFTASSPRLCLPEPAALFQFLPLSTVRISVRYRNPPDTFVLGCPFLCLRIKARIGRDQPRNASENPLVRFNRRQQQFAVARPFLKHLIMCDGSGSPLPVSGPACQTP